MLPNDCHLIDHGRVGCPVRGHDVEVDTCAGCDHLLAVDEKAPLPFVRCSTPESALNWFKGLFST
jgi:hypothetical protein